MLTKGITNGCQQINNNGPLSFGEEFSDFTPKPFPLNASTLIAPFWDDIDNRHVDEGNISYRLTTDPDDIQRAREDVLSAKFAVVNDFTPTYLLIATWYQVPEYRGSDHQVKFLKSTNFCILQECPLFCKIKY